MTSAHTSEGRGEMARLAKGALVGMARYMRKAPDDANLSVSFYEFLGARSLAHQLRLITSVESHRLGKIMLKAHHARLREIGRCAAPYQREPQQ